MIDNGYRIVVVGNNKAAVDKGWPDKVVTKEECLRREGNFSVGVQTGTGSCPVYAFDLDSDDPGVTDDFIGRLGTRSLCIRTGQDPRKAVFFRMADEDLKSIPERLNSFKKGAAEVSLGFRGARQYMVAYGVHHIKNEGTPSEEPHLYSWDFSFSDQELLYMKAEALPFFTVEDRDEVIKMFREVALAHGYKDALPSEHDTEDDGLDKLLAEAGNSGLFPQLTIEQAGKVLYGSGADPDDYSEWVSAGMSLHHEFKGSSDAMELWDEWSAQSEKYKGIEDIEKHWNSFRLDSDNPVTIAWLIYRYKLYHGDFDKGFHIRGMAERLKVLYRGEVRKAEDKNVWWSFNGFHWEKHTQESIDAKFRKDMELEYQKAIMQAPKGDEKAKERAYKWRAGYEKNPAAVIKSVKDCFKTLDGVLIDDAYMDSNTRYLGVINGDIDLDTGELLAPDPARLVSKVAPVRFDSSAKAPLWRKTVRDCLGSEEAAECFKRYVGYSLTGSLCEDTMAFLYGYGSNGKSKVMAAISAALGSYSTAMVPETLVSRISDKDSSSGAAREDIMMLKGVRVAVAEELDAEVKIRSETVKRLASKTTLAARGLYEKTTVFDTTASVFLCTNHLPKIRDNSNGMTRRLVVFEFGSTFKDADKITDKERELGTVFPKDIKLLDKLKNELPGILNWALEGLKDYKRIGLRIPKSMTAARDSWVNEEDAVALWAETRLEEAPGEKVSVRELMLDFNSMAGEFGTAKMTANKLRKDLVRKGYGIEADASRVQYLIGYKLLETEELW